MNWGALALEDRDIPDAGVPGCAGSTSFTIFSGVLVGMEGLAIAFARTDGGVMTMVSSWLFLGDAPFS